MVVKQNRTQILKHLFILLLDQQ